MTLSKRIDRCWAEVTAGIEEPWRAGLTGILTQLELAVEAFVSLRTATATDVVASAERLTHAQMTSVRREVLPARPPDAGEATVFDRKADLIRLLDPQPSGQALEDYVLALAWEAIRDRDDLTIYCLASGPLDLYYRSRRTDAARLRERILSLMGKGSDARVLRWFSGPDGIPALVLEVKQALLNPRLLEEVQQALLRPRLELETGGPDGLGAEELREVQEIEQEFRQIAAMAGDLAGERAGRKKGRSRKAAARPGSPEPPQTPSTGQARHDSSVGRDDEP